jgi:hypothetical protein
MLSLRREVCKGNSVILKSDITISVTKAREATARSTLRYAETDLETAALQIRYMLSFKQGSYQNNTPKVKMYSVMCSAVLSFHIKYKFKYEILAVLWEHFIIQFSKFKHIFFSPIKVKLNFKFNKDYMSVVNILIVPYHFLSQMYKLN